MEATIPLPPDYRGIERGWGYTTGFWKHPFLTLFRQPQEQHVAVGALSAAGGWSHFELVVLAPVEAPKLCALPASQQGLCPRGSLAPRGGLGPEQGGVGLSRCSGATHLEDGGQGGLRALVSSPFWSCDCFTPRSRASPSS